MLDMTLQVAVSSFNSRLREEATSSIYSLNWLRKVSTHASVRRRRAGELRENGPQDVSTHASVRRRRAGELRENGPQDVSTHASVRRRRPQPLRLALSRRGFNSRLREEATIGRVKWTRCMRGFNSRLREEATNRKEADGKPNEFQLTPP